MDLPYLLSVRGGRITDVTLVGVVAKEIEKPPIFNGIELKNLDDRCVVVDLVGYVSGGEKSFVKGRVMAIVPNSVVVAASNKNSGRIAVAMSAGSVRASGFTGEPTLLSMSRWVKTRTGSWRISAVACRNVTMREFPEFFSVISNAYKNDWNFKFPISLSETYQVASAGYDFDSLEAVVQRNSPQSHNESKPTPPVPTPTVRSNQQSTPQVNHSSLPPVGSNAVVKDLLGSAGSDLGVSTESNIATLVQNRELTDKSLKKQRMEKIKNRSTVLPATKSEKLVVAMVRQADEKVTKIIDSLSSYTTYDEEDGNFKARINYTGKMLYDSWVHKVGDKTGRQIFKDAWLRLVEDFDGSIDKEIETEIGMYLDVKSKDLAQLWAINGFGSLLDDSESISALVNAREHLFIIMVDQALHLHGKLEGVYSQLKMSRDIDLEMLLCHNPYALCYFDPSFSVTDLDKIAMFFQIDRTTEDIAKTRDVSYMHNYMLDSSNTIIGNNTTVPRTALESSITTGYCLTSQMYSDLQNSGLIIKKTEYDMLQYYLNPNLTEQDFTLPKDGWRQRNRKYILPDKRNKEQVVTNFINSGLGVEYILKGDSYVSDFIFAHKEIYIHKRLREMANDSDVKRTYSDTQIRKAITDFCEMKDKEFGLSLGTFKLEAQQEQAVYQSGNPIVCLTGPAGSGKTTTAEALVYAVTMLGGVDPDKIMFCAPTGKAARRLKEVVKKRTRTIHSLFRISGNSMRLGNPAKIDELKDVSVLIVDETSMPNVNLMYDMLMRIPDGTRIFFLGDIEQLSPIGFGKPFSNMMTYLPTVVLNVEKRASHTSGTTLNSRKIIYDSEGHLTDLGDYDDFRIVHTTDVDKIVNALSEIVQYHLGRNQMQDISPIASLGQDLKPDDIQVISPINGREWGVVALNKKLQEIFNPYSPMIPAVNYIRSSDSKTTFRLGDRVIHTKRNQSERERLIRRGRHSFVLEESRGINNGDVGKIVGFHSAEDLDFDYEEIESNRLLLQKTYRGTEKTGFVEVQYKDFSEEKDEIITFSVLYRYLITNDMGLQSDVIGKDVGALELAYALTVDKMQGSEAKLVINIILAVRGDFLSRNRIYTALSRARQGQYLIGDVFGSRSAINSARKVVQTERRLTLMDTFED